MQALVRLASSQKENDPTKIRDQLISTLEQARILAQQLKSETTVYLLDMAIINESGQAGES